jgi:hypothetical protein
MVKQQKKAWTFFRNQQTSAQGEEIQDRILFLLRWHGRQGNLEDQYSYQQVYECDQGPSRQSPTSFKMNSEFFEIQNVM